MLHTDRSYFDYLQRLDLGGFAQRAQAFWDDPPLTESAVFDRFLEVVSIPTVGSDERAAVSPVTTLRYPAGQIMWRVRGLQPPSGDAVVVGMNHESDLWEAPTKFVTARGRLNGIGESVLYVSIGDPVVAMREARIAAEGSLALIKYETTDEVTLTSIAAGIAPEDLPGDLISAHAAVASFYREVFTREFDGANDLTYVLSNKLVKDWFDLPAEVADGWCFPSIAHGKGVNAAFRPSTARRLLRVVGVAFGEAVDSALLGHRLKATHFSPGAESDGGGFQWFAMGSSVQGQLFPEFR